MYRKCHVVDLEIQLLVGEIINKNRPEEIHKAHPEIALAPLVPPPRNSTQGTGMLPVLIIVPSEIQLNHVSMNGEGEKKKSNFDIII